MLRIPFLFFLIFLICSCVGRPSTDDPKLSDLNLNLEEFFDGEVVAYGQFQDRFGTVRSRFKVDILGTFDGKTLILEESFVYSDNSSQNRTWTLVKLSDSDWKGSAPDVIGVAKGKEIGDLFNWQYNIDLPVGDDLLRVLSPMPVPVVAFGLANRHASPMRSGDVIEVIGKFSDGEANWYVLDVESVGVW